MKTDVKHIFSVCLLAMSVTGTIAQCITPKERKLRRKIFTKVEVMPEFPGGLDGWRRFLEKSFQLSDDFGKDSCGLLLSFRCSIIVEPDGSLSNITINNKCDTSKFCVGEKACFYMLKQGPKWVAGKQNKKAVPVRVNQRIGIEVGEL